MSSSNIAKPVGVAFGEDEVFGESSTTSLKASETESENLSQGVAWPEDYFDQNFDLGPSDAEDNIPEEQKNLQRDSVKPTWGGENEESFEFYYPFTGEEETSKEEVYPTFRETTGREVYKPASISQEPRRRSLFVHSSPTHFPDINRARKSVFGSIFLRTTAHVAEETALLRTVAESNYSMLQSLLDSFDKILSAVTSDTDKKQMTIAYKESVLRALENHGITRTYSDGSVHWDIYPITKSYLFSVQVGDRIHQTRHLSRIEDRIESGPVQGLRYPYSWPTDSLWTGHWDILGMAGLGTYVMPHGVSYNGKMRDGMFHDDNATLTYPNKFKALHCVYENGKLLDCQFQFPDMLNHEKENWSYCKFPDRRFWSEVRNGLKPAKVAQKTEIDPPRRIPTGCYDTNDGFYNPKSLLLLSPPGELLRVPVCEEDIWIKKYCRKGFLQPADFRPDLYENWFNYDDELIQSLLDQQDKYRKRKITYDQLQQFYADLDLLPSWSKYKKRVTPSEIAEKEYLKSIPYPKILNFPRQVEKYEGHKISSKVKVVCTSENNENKDFEHSSCLMFKKSKSFIKFNKVSRPKIVSSSAAMNARSSKISVKISRNSIAFDKQGTETGSVLSQNGSTPAKKKIPERFLKSQPILRPPFMLKSEINSPPPKLPKKKCLEKMGSDASDLADWGSITLEKGTNSEMIDKKELQRFMKRLVMDAVIQGLIQERERHRKRLKWAQKVTCKPSKRENPNEKCLKVLEELFESIPEKEEYCDSIPSRTCDFKKLAEDKYNMLKYWGKRMFTLEFEDEKRLH